jgi:hypothetical protein
VDPVLRAYATLRVSPHAPLPEVRRQFRKLVRQWHPDRFADDPQGQAEAATQMRDINAAYRLIQDERAPYSFTPPPTPTPQAPPAGTARAEKGSRLGRQAVEALVRSLGTESPVDAALAFIGWFWPLPVAFLIVPPRHALLHDGVAQPHPLDFVFPLLLVVLAVVLRRRQRRLR